MDALKELRHVAQLSVSQTEPCPDIGTDVASVWGDVDCNGSVTSVDALMVLRHLVDLPVSQEPGCPEIGGALAAALEVVADGVFGDVDCDAAVNAVDALKILRYVVSLPVSQPQGCSPIGI